MNMATYKSPIKRKENDLNQTSRELCSMLIFRGFLEKRSLWHWKHHKAGKQNLELFNCYFFKSLNHRKVPIHGLFSCGEGKPRCQTFTKAANSLREAPVAPETPMLVKRTMDGGFNQVENILPKWIIFPIRYKNNNRWSIDSYDLTYAR